MLSLLIYFTCLGHSEGNANSTAKRLNDSDGLVKTEAQQWLKEFGKKFENIRKRGRPRKQKTDKRHSV